MEKKKNPQVPQLRQHTKDKDSVRHIVNRISHINTQAAKTKNTSVSNSLCILHLLILLLLHTLAIILLILRSQ